MIEPPTYVGRIFGISGHGPHKEKFFEDLITNNAGLIDTKERRDPPGQKRPKIWQLGEIVIIGRNNFDKVYLLETIEIAGYHGSSCDYMSQEDFLELHQYGTHPQYQLNQWKIYGHPGLEFLASIGFRWPSTFGLPGIGGSATQPDYNTQSELAARFGYSVAKDVPVAVRHSKLRNAIAKPPSGMGLQEVAYSIAALVRWRKTQLNDRVQGAIERWEEDLDWLHREYYLNSPHSFVWPAIE